LGNVKDIEQHLRGNTLDAVITDFAAHTFQWQQPWIAVMWEFNTTWDSLAPLSAAPLVLAAGHRSIFNSSTIQMQSQV